MALRQKVIKRTAVIFVASLFVACASSVQKTQAVSQSSDGWLIQADLMPTYDIVPPQPRLSTMLAGETEIEAKTTIEFYVDERGKVNQVLTNIKETSGYDALDRIALQWAKQIIFHPGMHKGELVKVILSKEIQWMVR